MYCNTCGTKISPGFQFCPTCSRPIEGVPPAVPPQRRIAKHVTLLGALWIAYAVLSFFGAFVLVILNKHLLGVLMSQPDFARVGGFIRPIFHVVAFIALGRGILAILAGVGLLAKQSWGRILAVVVGCISLIHIPVGTALGIYTIWVMLGDNGEQEYREVVAGSPRS